MDEKEGRSHFILYAKGWYKRSESVIQDLKVINGNYSDCEPEHIYLDSIFYHLTAILLKYYPVTEHHRFMELFDVFKYDSFDKSFTKTEILVKQIEYFVSMIGVLPVKKDEKRIIHLCAPDWNILPPSTEDSQKHWEEMHKEDEND